MLWGLRHRDSTSVTHWGPISNGGGPISNRSGLTPLRVFCRYVDKHRVYYWFVLFTKGALFVGTQKTRGLPGTVPFVYCHALHISYLQGSSFSFNIGGVNLHDGTFTGEILRLSCCFWGMPPHHMSKSPSTTDSSCIPAVNRQATKSIWPSLAMCDRAGMQIHIYSMVRIYRIGLGMFCIPQRIK